MVAPRVPAWEAQQHGVRLLGPALALPVLAGVVAYAVAAVPAEPGRGWLRLAVVGLGLAAACVLVAAPVARWLSCRLVVTATRVTVRDGLLRRRERSVPLGRVAEVRTVQTVLGRLLGHGTLLVVPEDGALLRCDHVPSVRSVQALVLERAEAAGAGRARPAAAVDEVDAQDVEDAGGHGNGHRDDPEP